MSYNKNIESLCRSRTGPNKARLCQICSDRCARCLNNINEFYESPAYICGECAFGDSKDRCIICSSYGVMQAFYCRECVLMGKDRDGCPKRSNTHISHSDVYFERKRTSIVKDVKF